MVSKNQKRHWQTWYNKNKKKQLEYVMNRRKKIRKWLQEYKKTLKCERCTENHPACLDFHHVAGKKDIEISKIVNCGRSIESIKKEMAKCIVLCANCHRKEHIK